MTPSTKFAIGIDIGGTKIEAAIVSSCGQVTQQTRHDTPQTAEATEQLLLSILQSLQEVEPGILGVGLSIPGSLDPQNFMLRNAPNSPAINNTNFFGQLRNKMTLPCKIENDANCLILSEIQFGVAQNSHDAVGIIMGTGFGSGVVVDKHLLKSHRGLAAELGHTLIDVNGRTCLCGNRGCVEAYLSGPSILKRYQESGGNVCQTTKEIFLSDDKCAKQIIKQTLQIFDRFIASIVSMYDPELIVLGGGLSNQECFYNREALIAQYLFGSRQMPPIKKAAGGDASGKCGAAALFF